MTSRNEEAMVQEMMSDERARQGSVSLEREAEFLYHAAMRSGRRVAESLPCGHEYWDAIARERRRQGFRGFLRAPMAFGCRRWFYEGPLKVYVRYPRLRLLEGEQVKVLDIASIEVDEMHRGRGLFTDFLGFCETLDKIIYIENVMEERFQEFFGARGYTARLIGSHGLQIDFYKDFRSKV